MCVALILLANAFYKVYYWLFDLCEHAFVSALLLATVFFFFLPVVFNLESCHYEAPQLVDQTSSEQPAYERERVVLFNYQHVHKLQVAFGKRTAKIKRHMHGIHPKKNQAFYLEE
ncbi:unnamed protein product [Heligmosomoides polygyrus]|uniref:XK-related protein n=1 Tax=Heligmosomoides polygyrus TaxID=6339 RepID=A0A183G184_HELPZ|nr:unnamed protein product [Heligmosomoides polygyrus]